MVIKRSYEFIQVNKKVSGRFQVFHKVNLSGLKKKRLFLVEKNIVGKPGKVKYPEQKEQYPGHYLQHQFGFGLFR